MLQPSALRPSSSGLAWGATREESRKVLGLEERGGWLATNQVERWAPNRFNLGGEPCYGNIWFGDDGLRYIRVYLHVTTDFWHRKFSEPGPEPDEVLTNKAIPAYEAAVAAWAAILGPPTWSGINPKPRRPEQWGWHVAYWHVGDDQVQVEIHREDNEFPYVVALASFSRVPMAVPVDPLVNALAATDVSPYHEAWLEVVNTDPAEAIRRFVGRPKLPLIEEHGRWHLPYLTGNPAPEYFVWGYFEVDAAGRVLHADMAADIVPLFGHLPAAEAPVSRPAALRAAETFLASRVRGFGDLELHREESEPRGEWPDGRPYEHHQFTWYARHGPHRALGLAWVAASVDSAGSLVKFDHHPPVPITVSLEPTITRDAAVTLALARYGKPVTSTESELHVGESEDNDDSQILYWIVSLTGTKPWHADETRLMGASYAFDAHTGRLRWEYVSQEGSERPHDDATSGATQE